MDIILDLETTTVEISEAKIVDIAFTYKQGKYNKVMTELVNPQGEIQNGAKAVHHITEEMIKSKQPFKETDSFALLNKLNTSTNNMIGHNIIEFDSQVLRNNGFDNKMQLIDTLVLIKHLEPNLSSYKQASLLYSLELNKTKEYRDRFGVLEYPNLHRAEVDIFITGLLLNYIKKKLRIKGYKYRKLTDKLISLSNTPVILTRMPFGKYKGVEFTKIITKDIRYVKWMFKNLDGEVITSLRYWLNKLR
jgi:exodeoxyribonuclease X